MKYLHITDTHLDFLFSPAFFNTEEAMIKDHFAKVDSFLKKILVTEAKHVLLTGDISSGRFIQSHIEYMGNMFQKHQKKLFFILGNHDYYHSSFSKVKNEIKTLTSQKKFKNTLHYLTNKSYYDSSTKTLFVGSDGWYDGEYSPFLSSTVNMNDYYIIEELNSLRMKSVPALREECKRLSKVAARQVKDDIDFGVTAYSPEKIIVLTHVPPFRELSTHKGIISNEEWLPCFSSKFFGDMLLETAAKNKEIKFQLFCGHSHDKAEYQPLENLCCHTGPSEYGCPEKSISIIEI